MARNPDPSQLSFLPQPDQNQPIRFRSLEPQLELSQERLQQWKQAVRDFQQQVRTGSTTQGTLFDLPSHQVDLDRIAPSLYSDTISNSTPGRAAAMLTTL